MPDWNPHDHPRNRLGEFRRVLGALSTGQTIKLPDGTTVQKTDNAFRVNSAPGQAGKPHHLISPRRAAEAALNMSAASTDPKSLGGGEPTRRSNRITSASLETTSPAKEKQTSTLDGLTGGGKSPSAKAIKAAAKDLDVTPQRIIDLLANTGRISGKDHRRLTRSLGSKREAKPPDGLSPEEYRKRVRDSDEAAKKTGAALKKSGSARSRAKAEGERENPKLPGAPHPEDVAAKAAKARKAAKLPSRKERAANEHKAERKLAVSRLHTHGTATVGDYLIKTSIKPKAGEGARFRIEKDGKEVESFTDAGKAFDRASMLTADARRSRESKTRRDNDESPMPGVIRKPSESDAIRAAEGRKITRPQSATATDDRARAVAGLKPGQSKDFGSGVSVKLTEPYKRATLYTVTGKGKDQQFGDPQRAAREAEIRAGEGGKKQNRVGTAPGTPVRTPSGIGELTGGGKDGKLMVKFQNGDKRMFPRADLTPAGDAPEKGRVQATSEPSATQIRRLKEGQFLVFNSGVKVSLNGGKYSVVDPRTGRSRSNLGPTGVERIAREYLTPGAKRAVTDEERRPGAKERSKRVSAYGVSGGSFDKGPLPSPKRSSEGEDTQAKKSGKFPTLTDDQLREQIDIAATGSPREKALQEELKSRRKGSGGKPKTGDKAASAAWRNQLRDLKDGGKSITIQSPSGSLQVQRKGNRYTVRNLRTYTEHQADRAGTESWIRGLLGEK